MKKTDYEVVVDNLNVYNVEDIEGLVLSKRKEFLKKDITISRCSLEMTFGQITIRFYKELTQQEVDVLKKEQEDKEVFNKKEREQRAIKASEAAKKAWVTRKANQEKEELKRYKAAENARISREKAKTEKQKLAEIKKKEKDFLHNLLYGED